MHRSDGFTTKYVSIAAWTVQYICDLYTFTAAVCTKSVVTGKLNGLKATSVQMKQQTEDGDLH